MTAGPFALHFPIWEVATDHERARIIPRVTAVPGVAGVVMDRDSWWEWGEPLSFDGPRYSAEHVLVELDDALTLPKARAVANTVADALTATGPLDADDTDAALMLLVVPHVVLTARHDFAECYGATAGPRFGPADPPPTPGVVPDHDARPDDDPEPGDRCKDCGAGITWVGPGPYDWQHAA